MSSPKSPHRPTGPCTSEVNYAAVRFQVATFDQTSDCVQGQFHLRPFLGTWRPCRGQISPCLVERQHDLRGQVSQGQAVFAALAVGTTWQEMTLWWHVECFGTTAESSEFDVGGNMIDLLLTTPEST